MLVAVPATDIATRPAAALESSFESFDYASVSDPLFVANWTEIPASLGGGVEGISIETQPNGNKVIKGYVANTPGTGWSQVYDARAVTAADAIMEFDIIEMNYDGGDTYREFMAGFDFRASETACYRFEYYYAAPEGMTERLRLITQSRNYPETEKVLNSTAWRAPSFPESHHVRIECVGAEISVYADYSATPLLTASDPTLTSGYVGTYLQSGDGGWLTINATRSMDNITVVPYSSGGVPSHPQSLSVTPADSLLTVSWQAPYSDGGSAVTEYRVYRGGSPGTESYLASVTSPTMSYQDHGVTNGIAYYYYVTAVNSYGEGLPSGEVSGVPYAEFGDISYLKITSGTDSFDMVSSSSKYVQVLAGGYLNGTVYLSAYNAWTSSAVVTMISTPSWGDHESSYSTVANLGVGYGTYTVSSASFRAPSTPGTYYIVFAFRAEGSGSQVASATNWAYGAPVWNDGNDIASFNATQVASAQSTGRAGATWLLETGYSSLNVPSDVVTVEVVSSGDPEYSSSLAVASGTGTFSPLASQYKSISVVAGETVEGTVELVAENAWLYDGVVPLVACPSWGDHESSTVTVTADVSPGWSTATASLELDAPSLPGSYFIVFAFAAEQSPGHVASASSSDAGEPVWDDGNDLPDLTASQVSAAQVQGRTLVDWLTADGLDPFALPADAVVVDVVSPLAPSEVQNLGVEVFPSKDSPSLSLHWAPPDDDGGYPLTEYRVYSGPSANQLVLQEAQSATQCSTNYTGFPLGSTYYYTVTAVNPAGEGPKAPAIYARIPGVPSQVMSVVGVFVADRVLLTWMPPGDDGGSPVTGYVVIKASLTTDLTDVVLLDGSAIDYEDTSVSPDEVYRYCVLAQNAYGNGTYSSMVLVVTEDVSEEDGPDVIKLIELVGGIAGAIALLIPVVALLRKRSRRKRSSGDEMPPPPPPPDSEAGPEPTRRGRGGSICPKCGAAVKEGWFCNFCGEKLR